MRLLVAVAILFVWSSQAGAVCVNKADTLNKKTIIYQVFTRTFGNKNLNKIENGTIEQNGVGKMNDFTPKVLKQIRNLGATHVWYTGVIRHATATDYSAYGIPRQHPAVVKGKAGSPYAIVDYYDIDPDIAVDVNCRMSEFEQLVRRTHESGLKVIIDFVPNHVARQYKSIAKPKGIVDLGEDDDNTKQFDANNNFYYCPGEQFQPNLDLKGAESEPYYEMPAKATGNDRFDAHPVVNDWYETVKLNYGVNYLGGRSQHFQPVPDTWKKMTDILLFWASKGIDGFRCDMAEMVPTAFWKYATDIVRERYPELIFVGEVYDTAQYANYIASGFTYLYDKVGMYDCLRDVICERRPAASITRQWQQTDSINAHMLYFLENHDEQRIASDFFCGDAKKALPAFAVEALMMTNPVMLYAGQEYGERGMDKEGFSGCDGRSTIFDYWTTDAIYKSYFKRDELSFEQKELALIYQQILKVANREKPIREGEFFDLMYVNPQSMHFDTAHQYTFLRKCGDEVVLVVANFSGNRVYCNINIPEHAFDFWKMKQLDNVTAIDLLSGMVTEQPFNAQQTFNVDVPAYCTRAYKFNIKMENDENYVLNAHNKDEFPPAHTAEHLLNQVMIRMFGCERSTNAHIERKKSKISYVVDHKPSRKEEKAIEQQMNELIEQDIPVTFQFVDRNNIPDDVSISRLPDDASETLRIVRIGDFDVCPCIGKHVRSTSQIGRFELLGTNWDEQTHTFRIRFKVVQ